MQTLLLYEKEPELDIITDNIIQYYIKQYSPNLTLYFNPVYPLSTEELLSLKLNEVDYIDNFNLGLLFGNDSKNDEGDMLIHKVLEEFISKNKGTKKLVVKTSLMSFNFSNQVVEKKFRYLLIIKKLITFIKSKYDIDTVVLDYFTCETGINVSISKVKEVIEDDGTAILNFRFYERLLKNFMT